VLPTLYKELYKEYVAAVDDMDIYSETDADVGPEQLTPPQAKPFLLIIPAELIYQWAAEIRRFSNKFKPVVYYGDKRTSLKSPISKVDGKLTKASSYFNGESSNASVVIITSLSTMVARHGPTALKSHRIGNLGWSSTAATAAIHEGDPEWEYDLSGCFDIISIDEAHLIKNPDTSGHCTVAWLKGSFHVLATASVLPNSINDFDGFISFVDINRNLWTEENLRAWKVNSSVNPYELPDTHPAAVLCVTTEAVKNFITGDGVSKNAGFYLSKVWQKCLLRRTYVSKDPTDIRKTIGEALPNLQTRRIVCRFSKDEQKTYDLFSEMPLQKLAHILKNGKLVWNRKHARQLILNSTWTSFHYVGDIVHAGTMKEWKALPNLLFRLTKALHLKQKEVHGIAQFEMPRQDDIPSQLRIICQGAPKLRHTLRIVGELVVLMKRKVVIWCAIPANQLLLHACLQALRISNACYSSELSHSERSELVNAFTTQQNSCHVFVGGFNVGSVELNLQTLCNHCIEFDSPPNKGIQDQAIGRLRRLNQPYTVEKFELSVEQSFQNRQIQNSLRKAIPGALAELSVDVEETNNRDAEEGDTEKKQYNIGDWYLVDGDLIQGPDPRVNHLPVEQRLKPAQFVEAILDSQRGIREDVDHLLWETEELDDNLNLEF